MVEKKEMPLESYFIGHQDAKLTDAQRKILTDYFKSEKQETERKLAEAKAKASESAKPAETKPAAKNEDARALAVCGAVSPPGTPVVSDRAGS